MNKDWGKCFTVETTTVSAMTSINFEDDWIVDWGYNHRLTSDASKFSSLENCGGNDAVITANNTIHPVEREDSVTFSEGDPITLENLYHVLGMWKNLFLVANAVDTGYYVSIGSKDVKFLQNLSNLEADTIRTGKRVKCLFVLSATSSYVSKMSTNKGVLFGTQDWGILAWIS